MNIKQNIESKLNQLKPSICEVTNESFLHRVPENAQTHFKVVLATDQFEGKRRLDRHKMMYDLLKEEMQSTVHALRMSLYTKEEWKGLENKEKILNNIIKCANKKEDQ